MKNHSLKFILEFTAEFPFAWNGDDLETCISVLSQSCVVCVVSPHSFPSRMFESCYQSDVVLIAVAPHRRLPPTILGSGGLTSDFVPYSQSLNGETHPEPFLTRLRMKATLIVGNVIDA